MQGAVVFTILDLASGYHQMRMAPNSKQFTVFRTNHEIYQWNVASMGLAGMPGTWTRLMRKVLCHFSFVVVYLDDICIFSKSMDEHVRHLRQVCEVLRANKLYARPDKGDFGQSSVDFLGHTISVDGLHVDSRKTRAIAEWPETSSVKELQRFLGLAGYYRRFINPFAALVLPLSQLTKKDVDWMWSDEQRQAFNAIKLALQHAPVLQLPDFDKPFNITTDVSHSCIGGVLSQLHDGHDLPVAFFSKKLGPHELNWPVHEKELFAIKQALMRWRHYVHGTPFDIYTDNSACKWFLRHPRVSGRLARWLDVFAGFQFTLHHRPGVQNVVADALSRPPEPLLKQGGVTVMMKWRSLTSQCALTTWSVPPATHGLNRITDTPGFLPTCWPSLYATRRSCSASVLQPKRRVGAMQLKFACSCTQPQWLRQQRLARFNWLLKPESAFKRRMLKIRCLRRCEEQSLRTVPTNCFKVSST
ncbi:unnamed protein product [Phytophthora fragariaefolia]|uniref:Unnamed protein product n=1 Tax=Phytophthora fragariaefolia TaxID=1490495 RepID=A0A9W6Y3N0_9STRA|nr:unnamed protein product [Phytophthora fragariaefolia]